MRMRPIRRAVAVVASLAAVAGGTALASAAVQPATGGGVQSSGIKHVLLISVDGMHQQDLTWYVQNFPRSTLATLVGVRADEGLRGRPVGGLLRRTEQ